MPEFSCVWPKLPGSWVRPVQWCVRVAMEDWGRWSRTQWRYCSRAVSGLVLESSDTCRGQWCGMEEMCSVEWHSGEWPVSSVDFKCQAGAPHSLQCHGVLKFPNLWQIGTILYTFISDLSGCIWLGLKWCPTILQGPIFSGKIAKPLECIWWYMPVVWYMDGTK